MSFFSQFFSGAERKIARTRKSQGFRAATPQELYGPYADVWKMGQDAGDDVEKIVAFIKAAEDLIANKAMLPHGVMVGSAAPNWAGDFDTWLGESAREDFGTPFRKAHEQCNSPMSAALYAKVCNALAFDARGTGWAHEVTDKGWANMAKWQDRAVDALGAMKEDFTAAIAAGEAHLFEPWATSYFNIVASSNESVEELLGKYEALSQANPNDLYMMISVGHWLMPRWSGAPLEVLDGFARECMKRTEALYGRGAYSYVYAALSDYHEIDETPCDPELMDAGWRDLRERFPSVRLQNLHTEQLYWADLYDKAWAELAHDLRSVDASSWGEDNSDADKRAVKRVVRTYMHLKDMQGTAG